MRMRRIPDAENILKAHDRHYVELPERCRGGWQAVFGNANPIYAEFGGGKGQFSVELAHRHPDWNIIMVDAVKDVLVKAVRRADAHASELPNLRFICIDLNSVQSYFAPGEIAGIFLNFSDPWPKNRHQRRRLTHEVFLKAYQEVLAPGGKIRFKTDNRGFFEFSLNTFAAYDMHLSEIALDLHACEPEDNIRTEYEARFSAMGYPIYRAVTWFRE